MKNNVLSAFVVFFAVVACLLIIDDLSHNIRPSESEANSKVNTEQNVNESLATLDLDTSD